MARIVRQTRVYAAKKEFIEVAHVFGEQMENYYVILGPTVLGIVAVYSTHLSQA